MRISISFAAGYKVDWRNPKLRLRGALFPKETKRLLGSQAELCSSKMKSYKLINIMAKDNSDGEEFTSDQDVKYNIAGQKTIR